MLNRLCAETREYHGRIESNPLHKAIVDGTVTRTTYKCLIERMYAVHACFEHWAGRRTEWPQFGFDFEGHRRLHTLAADLAALEASAESMRVGHAGLPLEDASFPFILGYLYVLEGSTLGGQILGRLIAKHLGVTSDRDGAYFHSYGPLVGARWQACQALLNKAGAVPDAADAIIKGAVDAFERIDAVLRAA